LRPTRRIWVMTSRVASKHSDSIMYVTPASDKFISPNEAAAVPTAMAPTEPPSFHDGCSSPAMNTANMVMTGVNACAPAAAAPQPQTRR